MPLVLGVDSSTQSTKVEVRDADTGELVATGVAPHPVTTPPRSEQDPGVWWTALLSAIAQTGHKDIAAISIAGQQHGMVVTDTAGAVLRPAKLWNDTESARHAQRLVTQFGAARWAKAVGVVPVSAITISKLAWLRSTEPNTFDRIGKVMLPHDWLTFRLTGRVVTDRGDASGTGYWSARQNRWRPDLLHRLDSRVSEAEWATRLPRVLGPADRADWLTAAIHEVVGLRGRPLVAAGTGDNMAAALGLGLDIETLAVSLGTSGTVFTVAEQATADPTGAVDGFADATGRYLPLVCINNATKVTTMVARLLGVDVATMARMALSEAPGAGGMVLVPHLDGERSPNRPNASGTLSGLRSDATPTQLARAAFEGVVCALVDGIDALDEAGVPLSDEPIRAVGGGARSRAYRQILADISGRPVMAPPDEELVARGACIQAAAVWAGTTPDDVLAEWGGYDGDITEPSEHADADAIRAAYASALAQAE